MKHCWTALHECWEFLNALYNSPLSFSEEDLPISSKRSWKFCKYVSLLSRRVRFTPIVARSEREMRESGSEQREFALCRDGVANLGLLRRGFSGQFLMAFSDSTQRCARFWEFGWSFQRKVIPYENCWRKCCCCCFFCVCVCFYGLVLDLRLVSKWANLL